jgi:hypothetical protein
MSDVPATTRMTTRPRNGTVHPGLVDASRKTLQGGVSKKRAAKETKAEKLQKKQDAIRMIGEVEKRMADEEMVTETPGLRVRKCQTGQLPRTYSFEWLPLAEDTETLDSDDEDTNNARHVAAVDTELSEIEPPKKKSKKDSVCGGVKQYIEQEHGENAKVDRRHRNIVAKDKMITVIESDLEKVSDRYINQIRLKDGPGLGG